MPQRPPLVALGVEDPELVGANVAGLARHVAKVLEGVKVADGDRLDELGVAEEEDRLVGLVEDAASGKIYVLFDHLTFHIIMSYVYNCQLMIYEHR